MTSSCTGSIELQWSTLHHPLLLLQTADLKYLLRQYEHWANFMYPKMTFKDVTNRIERLATKKEFKVRYHHTCPIKSKPVPFTIIMVPVYLYFVTLLVLNLV